jgi:hypothetical protein
MKVPTHPSLHVIIDVMARRAAMYQPIEGGWRCQADGPMRFDADGSTLTFDTLDDAAQHLANLITKETA